MGAFEGSGLYPLDPTRVLDRFTVDVGPSSPENESNQSEQQSSP